jgi:hypothetical protein
VRLSFAIVRFSHTLFEELPLLSSMQGAIDVAQDIVRKLGVLQLDYSAALLGYSVCHPFRWIALRVSRVETRCSTRCFIHNLSAGRQPLAREHNRFAWKASLDGATTKHRLEAYATLGPSRVAVGSVDLP